MSLRNSADTDRRGSASPIASTDRLATLDILRGFALLGMILAHFQKTLIAGGVSTGDHNPVNWFITLFVAEKDRTVFAFLFGCGFALMMRNLEVKGHSVVAVSLRRLAVLYLIGFGVESLTQFFILRIFAWWGVPLLFLRKYPTRALLAVAALSVAAFSLRDLVDGGYAVIRLGREHAAAEEIVRQEQWQATKREAQQSLRAANYSEVVVARVHQMARDLFSLESFTPNEYLALFILGLLAVRHGVFNHPKRHFRLIVGMMTAGVTLWILAWWVLPLLPDSIGTPRISMRLHAGLGFGDEQFLAFGYIGAVTLALAYLPIREANPSSFGYAGRMALTNYIIQAVVIDFLSAPYGLDLKIQPAMVLAASALLFGIQVLLSRFWLSHFMFGPVEWLWRSLTYWRWQQLRIPAK